tara:strand:+ start:43370 stop:44056 length:687 start_codon:yes stop_codon:yes gene_type:complete
MEELPLASTSPFYTLDACNGLLAENIINALELTGDDSVEAWKNLVNQEKRLLDRLNSQGITAQHDLSSIKWDHATLLFTTTIELSKDGRPVPLGDILTRERFGRFPWEDGSLLGYFLAYIRPNRAITDNDGQDIYDTIVSLLTKLTSYCTEQYRGHRNYEDGFGGMNIKGFITSEEVKLLRRNLSSRTWTASYEEPLDGGVSDAAKHFMTLLKSAERRDVGVMFRTHE